MEDWLPNARLPAEMPNAGAVPVPDSVMNCGLSVELSVRVRVARRSPDTEGVKITLRVQFAPGASAEPQVLAWTKSLAFGPLTVRLLRISVAVPLFATLIACGELAVATGWFAKERAELEKVTAGAIPVPVRLVLWGLLVALSVIVMEADRTPTAVGENVTVMPHVAPAGSEPPQLLAGMKS